MRNKVPPNRKFLGKQGRIGEAWNELCGTEKWGVCTYVIAMPHSLPNIPEQNGPCVAIQRGIEAVRYFQRP